MRKRALFVNLGLVCGSLLVAAVGTEWVLRLTRLSSPLPLGWVGQYENRPSKNFIADPHTGWRMRPNHSFEWTREYQTHTYRSNSEGFRSNRDFDSADRRYRIALVGDSYTFGTGVAYENTFPALLESRDRVAWSFAMPGFGVDQIWRSARYQALPLKPDLVVVGLVDADFERSQIPYRVAEGFGKPTFKLDGGRLVERTAEPAPPAIQRYLEDRSHLWAARVRALRWFGRRFGVGGYWSLNGVLLDELREDCRKAGVPLLVVYIPVKSFKSFPSLQAYMREVGANYLDLTEIRPAPPPGIYLPHDGHLSAEGHLYVANLIDQWLRSHL